MGWFNLSFGHLEGMPSRKKLVYQKIETTGKGLLVLLGKLTAVGTALAALLFSLRLRKQ